jgi:uncharacterized membrane protein YkvA (DUF1232 family)
MNRQTAIPSPLQLPVSFGPARRQEIGGRSVRVEALVHFNAMLRTIHAAAPRVDTDAIVSIARRMQDAPAAECAGVVSERMARVQVLRQMLRDPEWRIAPDLRVRARLLLAYVDKHEDLIPDGVELVGYLDDALMVELSWPRFDAEVAAYREFCAFRATHAGDDAYAAWAEQREEATRWQQYRAGRRERGYQPAMPAAAAILRVC